MGAHASPLTVIRANGRTFVAVGDMVNICREMADSVEGGPQSASTVLRVLADTFVAAGGGDELFHAPAPPPEPCAPCATPVHICDKLEGGTLVLNADATACGRWLIVVGASGRQVAARYEVGKHDRVGALRYREHACEGAS